MFVLGLLEFNSSVEGEMVFFGFTLTVVGIREILVEEEEEDLVLASGC